MPPIAFDPCPAWSRSVAQSLPAHRNLVCSLHQRLLFTPQHTVCGHCRYHDGVISNIKAFEADLDDSRHCRVPYCQGECSDLLCHDNEPPCGEALHRLALYTSPACRGRAHEVAHSEPGADPARSIVAIAV